MNTNQSNALTFNNGFLNQIVFHCIHDSEFLLKVRRLMPLNIFKAQEKLTVVKEIFKYYDDYKEAPKEDFFHIFEHMESQYEKNLYDRCIKFLGVVKDLSGSNSKYIYNRISDAVRHYQLEEASIEFASLIKNQQYDDAKQVIYSALRSPEVSETYNYFDDTRFLKERLEKNRFLMKTRIDALDEIIGGLKETWLVTLLAATKVGKTWFLLEMALQAALQGLNVLLISLEMGEFAIDLRLDMTSAFMSTQEALNNLQEVLKSRQKLKKMSSGCLEIRAFNRGRVNYQDIDLTLQDLEMKGIFIDVLVVDYLGVMRATESNQSKKDRITENCLGLKEIASLKNLICFSAMQGNRKAMQAKRFEAHMVADDIDTIFNSDLVLSLCQTKTEAKKDESRLYVTNYRHGPQTGVIGLKRNLSVGQIAMETYEVTDDDADDKNKDKETSEF